MHENPYQAPVADTRPVVGVLSGERADLRRVAEYQKALIFAISLIVLFYVALAVLMSRPALPPNSLATYLSLITALCLLAAVVTGTIFVFRLSIKVNGIVWGTVMAMASLVPCIGLLALLLVNEKGTKVLRANGVKVGLFGARMSDLSDG